MKEMRSRQDIDDALGAETAILFKHSTRCPISAAARAEMQRFMELQPDADVYTVDVHDSTEASRYLAEKTGIEHHSPQVIVTRGGQPEWHASHFDIRADEVGRRVNGAIQTPRARAGKPAARKARSPVPARSRSPNGASTT